MVMCLIKKECCCAIKNDVFISDISYQISILKLCAYAYQRHNNYQLVKRDRKDVLHDYKSVDNLLQYDMK